MKFALILSGCGQHDGSETHETILTLLSLAQENISWDAFAPNIEQHHVTNHVTNQVDVMQKRNVLEESARLVRGKIKPLTDMPISAYDAIIFPGGIGAVTNLCDWYEQGSEFSFNSAVRHVIDAAVNTKKPMGFICIAPMMIPKIYKNAKLTIGNDKKLAEQISRLGSEHIDCSSSEVVVDKQLKLVSTPANMLSAGIDEIYQGIHKLVKELALLVS